jgi:hypothetical protein
VLERSPAPPSDDDAKEAPAPLKPREKGSDLPAWIAFGVGGAGLVVGTVTGIMALGAHADLAERCPTGKCFPRDDVEAHAMRSDLSRYHTFGTVSGIGFVVAIAGGATGAVLLVTGRSKEGTRATAPALWPVVGAREVGVAGRF